MYPRNAASPERIAIGPVLLISDGTPQGAGVTVTVRGQGGAEAGSAGTIAYGATGVIVYYTPTQAETDFTSFTVIASKANCIPVCVTIVTSASATPGYAGVDWGKVTNATTAVNLSGTTTNLVNTLTTYTGNTVQTGDSFARIGANGAGLTNIDLPNQTMDIVGNITGNLSGSVGSVVGSVGGNVSGSVGSVTGAVGSVTGGVGGNVSGSVASVVGAVGSVTGNVGGNVVGTVAGVTPSTAAQVAAVLTTAITESYRANGAAPTLAQFMSEVLAHLGEVAISGTTKTILMLDHATPAETFTLDSATTPAAITRAT